MLVSLLLVMVGWTNAAMAGGPENVLVVVNADSAESLAVANHFIHLRKIPASNVVYLEGVPDGTTIPQGIFTRKILKPVVQSVLDRKLSAQIDYIVYSAGFPTTVKVDQHIQLLKEKAGKVDSRAFHPKASITSLTYFYADVLADNPSYFGLDSNWYMRGLKKDFFKTPFGGQTQARFESAMKKFGTGELKAATRELEALVKQHPLQTPVRYQLVRALAGQSRFDEALQQLKNCVATGWCYRSFTEKDEALSELAKQSGFPEVVESIPQYLFGQLPTRSFSNNYSWAPNGWINGEQAQGKRFVMSTQLAVADQLDNPLENAIAQLKRSAAADSTFPKGTFYFANTSDVRCKARANQFGLAIAELNKLGFEARSIRARQPTRDKAVLGATLGSARIAFAKSGNTFVPGALCDNLTSYGGILDGKHTQTRLTQFLREGATGASGTICEPLAIHQKFPSARLHVHYVRGCTLAEAFYQSISGPFQLLIVGDPLCKPWANHLKFDTQGISDGQRIKQDLQLKAEGTNENHPIQAFELFVDGRRGAAIPPGKMANVRLGDLADGYHELRVVAVAKHIIATKTGKSFGFMVDRKGHQATLKPGGNGKYQLKRSVPLTVESNFGESIEIYQNSRIVGTVQGRTGSISLDCEMLGQGPTTLRAIAVNGETRVSSEPVSIEIQP